MRILATAFRRAFNTSRDSPAVSVDSMFRGELVHESSPRERPRSIGSFPPSCGSSCTNTDSAGDALASVLLFVIMSCHA
jgi:hypothetical protein